MLITNQKSSNIIEKIYHKGEKPPPLNDEQKAMLQQLSTLSDDEIDTSDDWDNSSTKVIDTYQIMGKINPNLLQDFNQTCQQQHISANEVIGQFMQNYIQEHRV